MSSYFLVSWYNLLSAFGHRYIGYKHLYCWWNWICESCAFLTATLEAEQCYSYSIGK